MYRYNGFNQLVQAHADGQEVFYTYRPDGLRNSKETAGSVTKHLWDGQNIAADLTGGTISNRYVRGAGLILTDRAGVQQYYLYNGHGDVVQLAGSTGTVTWEYDYDAFGNQRELAGYDPANDANPFRYCGEYYDSSSGTYYLRNRHYNPVNGRFTQEDTVRARRMNLFDPYGDYQDITLSGGVFKDAAREQFVVDDPLSLNLYAYAVNNPIRFNDPSGNNPALVIVVINGIQFFADAVAFGLGVIIVVKSVEEDFDEYEEYEELAKTEKMDKPKGNTPGDNQKQNEQIDSIARELGGLTEAERRRLHDAISGQGLGYKEILDLAKSMFNK